MPEEPEIREEPPRKAAEQEQPMPSHDANEEPLPGEEELARRHERIVERPTD